MRIRQKDNLGTGATKRAYSSTLYPDRVIKVGRGIKRHARMFRSLPEIFPIVYKSTPKYIVLEKLDMEKAHVELVHMVDHYMVKYNLPEEFAIECIFYKRQKYKIVVEQYKEIIERIDYIVDLLFKETKEDLDVSNKNFGYTQDGVLKALDI